MPSLGDMTLVLNADERRMVEGLARAEAAAKRTSMSIGQTLQQGAGRNVQQMGFALQDFTSVLQQGGANSLGRAIGSITNNVQMLGQSMGPLGGAIFAVGGALAGMILPSLLKGIDSTAEYTTRIDELAKAMARLSQASEIELKFEQQRNRLIEGGNAGGMTAQKRQLQDDLQMVDLQIQNKRNELEMMKNAARAGGLGRDEVDGGGGIRRFQEVPGGGGMLGRLFGPLGEMIDRAVGGGREELGFSPAARNADFVVANEEVAKSLKKVQDEIGVLADKEKQLMDQRTRIAADERRQLSANAEAEGRKRALGQEMAEMQKRIDASRALEDSVKTPMERFREKSEMIERMLMRGEATPETAARAMKQARDELPAQKMSQAALIEGSAEAMAAILGDAERRAQEQETKRIQEDMLSELRETRKAIEEMSKAFDMQPVSID